MTSCMFKNSTLLSWTKKGELQFGWWIVCAPRLVKLSLSNLVVQMLWIDLNMSLSETRNQNSQFVNQNMWKKLNKSNENGVIKTVYPSNTRSKSRIVLLFKTSRLPVSRCIIAWNVPKLGILIRTFFKVYFWFRSIARPLSAATWSCIGGTKRTFEQRLFLLVNKGKCELCWLNGVSSGPPVGDELGRTKRNSFVQI